MGSLLVCGLTSQYFNAVCCCLQLIYDFLRQSGFLFLAQSIVMCQGRVHCPCVFQSQFLWCRKLADFFLNLNNSFLIQQFSNTCFQSGQNLKCLFRYHSLLGICQSFIGGSGCFYLLTVVQCKCLQRRQGADLFCYSICCSLVSFLLSQKFCISGFCCFQYRQCRYQLFLSICQDFIRCSGCFNSFFTL